MFAVVETLDVVTRWGVVGAPGDMLVLFDSSWIDPPVYVVHYMKSSRNVLVKIWLRMVVCHVVQEVDVGEGPAGKLVGIRPSLESDVMAGVFFCCSANHDY